MFHVIKKKLISCIVHCYLFAELNSCLSSPCLNGGQCISRVSGYVCVCTSQFIGTNCQTGK